MVPKGIFVCIVLTLHRSLTEITTDAMLISDKSNVMVLCSILPSVLNIAVIVTLVVLLITTHLLRSPVRSVVCLCEWKGFHVRSPSASYG